MGNVVFTKCTTIITLPRTLYVQKLTNIEVHDHLKLCYFKSRNRHFYLAVTFVYISC